MRDRQVATSLSRLPCVTIGGIVSARRERSLASLSSVLEEGPIPDRFFLSQRACAGILRRAARRGKDLPATLRLALEQVAGDSSGQETPGDRTA